MFFYFIYLIRYISQVLLYNGLFFSKTGHCKEMLIIEILNLFLYSQIFFSSNILDTVCGGDV